MPGPLSAAAIRDCLEGAIPSVMATCAPDGTPNVTYISQVDYVDADHVALSFQFFNKTRQNVLLNPRATVQVISPLTGARYRLALRYLRTETAGPLFERMKARLAGIASHTGMSAIFKLQGADVYRVLEIEPLPGVTHPPPAPERNLLAGIRQFASRITSAVDLAGLVDEALLGLEAGLDIRHAMLLMADEPGRRVYTVATRGYAVSGVGSEISFGQGVIGVAARERTPIRITHMSAEYAYSRAIRESAQRSEYKGMLETEIPFPGLAHSRSQLAVPIIAGTRLVGVLYVESGEDLRFSYDDEDMLVTAAALLGLAIRSLQETAENQHEAPLPTGSVAPVAGLPVTIRHYAADDSVFTGDDYLIKGVAGAIMWKLLRDYTFANRTEFNNRELRLDSSIRLPDVSDNLEARLILLQRRLAERCDFLGIEKTGRGRFRICVRRPVQLLDIPAGQR